MPEEATADAHRPTGESEAARAAVMSLADHAESESGVEKDAAAKWDSWNFKIGIPAALLAGGAGVSALTDLSGEWRTVAAIFALLGGGLAGIVTTLNPSHRAEQARSRAANLAALARQARNVAELDSRRFTPEELRDAIEDLEEWRLEIEGVPIRRSPYRKWLANRDRLELPPPSAH